MSSKEALLLKIKALRIEHNVAVEDIAKAIGFKSQKGYYDLEGGRSKLTLEKLEQIATYYKMKVAIFFENKSA